MRKIIISVLVILLLGAAVVGWLFFGAATGFDTNKETVYIRTTAATKGAVLDSLKSNDIVKHPSLFSWLANRMNYWTVIKPGKYDIKGSSLLAIVRMLRNGQQSPVNFTITKIRTKEDFARLVDRRFEVDSLQMITFLNSADSLKKYGVGTEEAMTWILPDTYTLFWNTTPRKVYEKFWQATQDFWTAARKEKAAALGLTPAQAYILASIVEEETNATAEKGTIASVYLNRIKTGMPLQADPTVKFALKDFGLRRIYEKHLLTPSPYNTYQNRGLPPAYLYAIKGYAECRAGRTADKLPLFCSLSDFNGTHIFAPNYTEHLKNAHAYQQALNEREAARKAKRDTL